MDYMLLGAMRAKETCSEGLGGPFGAVIVKDSEIVAVESNSVLSSHDPTAHAEINAIRSACKKLGTHDLSGCTLYATGYPCPMCLGAIVWSNIKDIYVSGLPEDAEAIGFRDEFIYDLIRNGVNDEETLKVTYQSRKPAQELYKFYSETHKEMY